MSVAVSSDTVVQPYRNDIDGLRAIAVVSVVIGHAFETMLPGGFLGVDVFFVISGYVITLSLLGRDHTRFGSFLAAFFLRRIKRLMPALLVCFVITCAVVIALDRQPKVSLITGALSLIGASNFALYAQELDYFSPSIKYNAFTHTWSLGVEEQFYLLFPLLFWLVFAPHRAGRARVLGGVVLGLSALSLLAYIAFQTAAPTATYYMMPFRFWELGAGVVAALWVHSGMKGAGPGLRPVETTLAAGGLCMIFVMAEPGMIGGHVAAVMLTAMLLIGGAGAGRPAWVLCNVGVTYVGRISYSLYLWHWPFLTFGLLAPSSLIAHPLLAIACATGAAVLSYHLVEQPVRRLRTPAPKARHFLTAFGTGIVAVVLIGGGYDLRRAQLAEVTVDPYPVAFALSPVTGLPYNPTCVVDEQTRLLLSDTFDNCTFPPTSEVEPRRLWVLGDSHAGHLQGGLIKLREDHGFGFHLVETPGAAFPVTQDHGFASRDALMEDVRAALQPGDVVVLSRLFFQRTDSFDLSADVPKWGGLVDALASDLAALDVDLLLIGPPPMFRFEDLRACDPNARVGCGVARDDLAPAVGEVHKMLDGLAIQHENTHVFKTFSILCPAVVPVCTPAINGVFQYRDRDHLNVAGAGLLVTGLAQQLGAMR